MIFLVFVVLGDPFLGIKILMWEYKGVFLSCGQQVYPTVQRSFVFGNDEL